MIEKSVLLVDDDEDILEFLEYNFVKEGYTVFTSINGEKAIEIAIKKNPSVIILDIMMKGMDGIQVCEKLHEMRDKITGMKMFLSARGEDYSQIAGFESGADDFVVKPINPKLLIKRVDALLRRKMGSESKSENIVQISSLMIDRERYIVTYNGESIVLPRKEFNLLELLASKPGFVFKRDEIYDKVWGDAYVGDRTIDVHIRKLREKLGEGLIVTVKGIGYKINITD
jgi:two-component system, OmpR family, alkaline phosphatase synthesis response regulator PhoP